MHMINIYLHELVTLERTVAALTSGLHVKVRPEKSQLWRIKSLYQLNSISAALHKLDLTVHTQTNTDNGTTRHTRRTKELDTVLLFWATLGLILPQQPHQVNLLFGWGFDLQCPPGEQRSKNDLLISREATLRSCCRSTNLEGEWPPTRPPQREHTGLKC